MAARQINLVDPDDAQQLLAAVAAFNQHGGGEKYLVGRLPGFRIHHFGDFQTLGQKADAAVYLAQAALAVQIVAILRTVAIAGRPVHNLHHLRPLAVDQVIKLILQALPAAGRDVVLSGGGQAPLSRKILFRLVVFLGKRLAHLRPSIHEKRQPQRPAAGSNKARQCGSKPLGFSLTRRSCSRSSHSSS